MSESREEEASQTPPIPPALEPAPLAEEAPLDLGGKIAQLERLVRSVARDSLALSRGQRDAEAQLQAIQTHLDDLELTTKGVGQTVWRAVQEALGQLQNAEAHYAGAIRELEARVRAEIQWQVYRSAAQSMLPALDDMDLVIGNQRALARKAAAGAAQAQDSVLEAMVMVRRKLVEGLRALGLEEIPIQEGATRFDPAWHEVTEPDISPEFLDDAGAPPGIIYRVRRAGFQFDGRIFRVARVLVKS
jgi:molecular chaperone GrpE (heat shock protein)